jgi:enterobacterial common antigen flippase
VSRFLSTVAVTVISRGVGMGMGLATAIATARFLGPQGRGLFFLALTWAGLATQFGSLGAVSGVIWLRRHHSASLEDLLGISAFQSLAAGSIAAIATLAFAALLGMVGAREYGVWPAVVLITVGGLFFQLVSSIMLADGRVGLYNGVQIANSGISGILIALVAWWFERPVAVAYAAGSAAILVAVLAAVMTSPSGSTRWRVNVTLVRRAAGFSARIYSVTLLSFLAQKISVIVFATVSGPEQIGYYSIAVQLCDALLAVPASVGALLFPKLIASGPPDWPRTRRTMFWTVATMVALALTIALAAPELLRVLFGHRFDSAVTVTRHLLPSVVFLSASSIVSQYIAAVGAPMEATLPWAIGAVVGAAWCAIASPSGGAEMAADAQVAANLTALAGLWVVARRCRQALVVEIGKDGSVQ